MSETVIKLENISKQYRLGTVGVGTLRGDMQRLWWKIRGKGDPFLKIGQENKLDTIGDEYVWALKDVNLEVKQGEVLGIIGKNGAGKSTLLKILSRVTTPTTGSIKVKGRIASLLEVGTGFHPELTGRENIFLNGAILGMTKPEIKSKFDEIIDFAGIAKYVDTPVKRYSSGMYVRLAFAVAAHLEPEILIVDEVLAVGDAEFQKKAIGKMQDISSGQGRTVLFVSHNMAAVKSLCNKGLLLANGQVAVNDDIVKTIDSYLSFNKDHEIPLKDRKRNYNNGDAFFSEISILNNKEQKVSEVYYRDKVCLNIKIDILKELKDVFYDIKITTRDEFVILYDLKVINEKNIEKGKYSINIILKEQLQPGSYFVTLGLHYLKDGLTIDYIENAIMLNILEIANNEENYETKWVYGVLRANANWQIQKI